MAITTAPRLMISEPLVEDLLQLADWVAAERKADPDTPQNEMIQVFQIESPGKVLAASFNRITNTADEPIDTHRIDNIGFIPNVRVYDLEGRLVTVDFEKAHTSDEGIDIGSATYHRRVIRVSSHRNPR